MSTEEKCKGTKTTGIGEFLLHNIQKKSKRLLSEQMYFSVNHRYVETLHVFMLQLLCFFRYRFLCRVARKPWSSLD